MNSLLLVCICRTSSHCNTSQLKGSHADATTHPHAYCFGCEPLVQRPGALLAVDCGKRGQREAILERQPVVQVGRQL